MYIQQYFGDKIPIINPAVGLAFTKLAYTKLTNCFWITTVIVIVWGGVDSVYNNKIVFYFKMALLSQKQE